MFHSTLSDLQNSVTAQIRDKEWPIDLIRATAGKEVIVTSRLTVIVEPPIPERPNPHLPGPYFDRVRFSMRVVTNTYLMINGPSTTEVAEYICEVLHGWQPPVKGVLTPLTLAEPSPWVIEKDPKNHPHETVRLTFVVAVDCGASIPETY